MLRLPLQRIARSVSALVLAMVIGPTAHGTFDGDEPSTPELIELDGKLVFTFTPGAWIPRLKGETALGDSGFTNTRFELGPDLRLDDMEPTVLPELAIRKREFWEMHFSGFRFSTSARGEMNRAGSFGTLDFAAQDPFHTEFSMTSIAAELRIGAFRPFQNERENNITSDGQRKVEYQFAPTFGLRYVEVSHRVERIGDGREDTGGTWVVPYAGIRMELTYRPDGDLPLIRLLRLEAGGAAGPALGADGGLAWQVRAGLTCSITDNVGVMFGYRLLELDVENEDYELVGGLQGLFLAASIRF